MCRAAGALEQMSRTQVRWRRGRDFHPKLVNPIVTDSPDGRAGTSGLDQLPEIDLTLIG